MSGFHRKLFAILIIAIAANNAYAQEWKVIQGKVIDAQSTSPLGFASIRVHRKNTGTLSNEYGEFVFKVLAAELRDSIEISFIGYESILIPVSEFADARRTVGLHPAVKVLMEATVRAKSGVDLINEFIARIPENYDSAGLRMQGYYRELIKLADDTLNNTEAVVDIYKSSYTKDSDNDQMVLLKGRRANVSWGRDPMRGWMSNLANGARGSLQEDMAKNYRALNSPLNPANFKYYTYTFENTVRHGAKNIYVVSFQSNGKMPRSRMTLSGNFYFDAASMALVRIEWGLGEAGIRYMNNHRGYGYTIMAVAYQATVHWYDVQETITWSELNGKWNLKQVQREFSANIISRKRNMNPARWKAKSLFVVTVVAPGKAERFDERENIMTNNSSIPTLMNGKDKDMKFWENYNVVQPEFIDTIPQHKKIKDTTPLSKPSGRVHGFSRADSLHGALTPLRTCYDVTFYHLDVRVDPENKFIEGSSIIRYKVVAPFSKIQVDLYANMEIEKIVWHDSQLPYTREYGAVYIEFPSSQTPGSIDEIKIFYAGHPQEPDFRISMNGGFLWSKDKQGKPWVQVVCQGSGASLWWPNKDHLSDEPDSARITVTVPSDLTDVSNGRLRSKTELPGGLSRYDWYVSYPINNYNITLNIGDYHHIRDEYTSLAGPLTLDYYYMIESEEKAKLIFEKVKPMLTLFEKDFGPYPFPRDGFTLMESVYPMEHQSAVSIGKFGGKTGEAEMEEITRLMYHEVSHEWWGNSVSIQDYADFWVHEAFASYAEALKIEQDYGYATAAEFINGQIINNREPVIGVYGVNHIFYEIGDIYNKGCLILNTLRHVINNDALWFDILRGIQRDFKYKTVTTADIENYISAKSKINLSTFFEQYLRHTQPPRLMIVAIQKGTSVLLKYKWQADVKDFKMPIMITVSKDKWGLIYPTSTWRTISLKNLLEEDLEVRDQDFYIEVVREDAEK